MNFKYCDIPVLYNQLMPIVIHSYSLDDTYCVVFSVYNNIFKQQQPKSGIAVTCIVLLDKLNKMFFETQKYYVLEMCPIVHTL